MNIVGRTNKQLIHNDPQRGGMNRGEHGQSNLTNRGKKGKKVKKYNPNKSNNKHSNKGKKTRYDIDERNFVYNEEEFSFDK
jgi:hypothetical protein